MAEWLSGEGHPRILEQLTTGRLVDEHAYVGLAHSERARAGGYGELVRTGRLQRELGGAAVGQGPVRNGEQPDDQAAAQYKAPAHQWQTYFHRKRSASPHGRERRRRRARDGHDLGTTWPAGDARDRRCGSLAPGPGRVHYCWSAPR